MRPVLAGPGSSTSNYRPTHDAGKNAAHQTQSDGFRAVSGVTPKVGGQSNPTGNPRGCTYCNKTVYHAEEQIVDGQLFHISCFSKYSKEKQQADLAGRNATYERPADVQPSYYRTGDTGEAPRMETGAEYKGNESGSAQPLFCGQCGTKRVADAKFCGQCGSKY